jgi:energy-dependent translational throttle protein EttA
MLMHTHMTRLATHILAFEDDGNVVWFEGSYSDYEADRRQRTGNSDPTRIKFRRLASVA